MFFLHLFFQLFLCITNLDIPKWFSTAIFFPVVFPLHFPFCRRLNLKHRLGFQDLWFHFLSNQVTQNNFHKILFNSTGHFKDWLLETELLNNIFEVFSTSYNFFNTISHCVWHVTISICSLAKIVKCINWEISAKKWRLALVWNAWLMLTLKCFIIDTFCHIVLGT